MVRCSPNLLQVILFLCEASSCIYEEVHVYVQGDQYFIKIIVTFSLHDRYVFYNPAVIWISFLFHSQPSKTN